MVLPAWFRESPNIRWLVAARVLRSLAQGFLAVVIPLYVVALGYSALAFGELLALVALGAAVFGLAAGIAGDRYGRRRAALAVGALSVVGVVGLGVARGFPALVAACIVSTFARNGGASAGTTWGPFFPVVQPLAASACRDEQRNAAFVGLALTGAAAAAVGSALAAIPAGLHAGGWTWLAAYRVMFWVGAGLAFLYLLAFVPLTEAPRPRGAIWPSRQALSILGRLSLTNVSTGLAMGLLGPLLTYWFYVRFHVGPAELGGLYTVANALLVLPFLGLARVTRRLGAVLTVAGSQVLSALLLAGQTLCTTFTASAAVYLLSILAQLAGMPIMQSYTMGVTEERHRSVVAALSGVPIMTGSAVSPGIGTALMESWTIDAPLLLGAALQVVAAAVYYALFRRELPPEERGPAARAAGVSMRAGGSPGG